MDSAIVTNHLALFKCIEKIKTFQLDVKHYQGSG